MKINLDYVNPPSIYMDKVDAWDGRRELEKLEKKLNDIRGEKEAQRLSEEEIRKTETGHTEQEGDPPMEPGNHPNAETFTEREKYLLEQLRK